MIFHKEHSVFFSSLVHKRHIFFPHPSDAAEDLGVDWITDQFPVDGGEGVTRGQRPRQRLLDLQVGHVFDRRTHVSLGARDDAGESKVVLRQGSRLRFGQTSFLFTMLYQSGSW